MSDSFSSQLLREIEDELHKPEEDESDLIDVKYEIIPGLRDGSAVMWAYEQKQIYYRNSYSADKHSDIRYSCYIKGCNSRVYVNSDRTAYQYANDDHFNESKIPHETQYQRYKTMYCQNLMREKAKHAPVSMTPRAIYMEVVKEWHKDPSCKGEYPKTFDEVKKTLSNILRGKYGKNPTNGKEVEREFQREYIRENLGCSLIKDAGPIYNGAVVTNDFDYCVFSSPKSISLILENVPQSERFFIIDGTFRITPKGVWQQTLIVHVMYKSKAFPLAFINMSRRTINAYISALNYVNDNLIPLRGKAIIIDFEKAIRKALIRILKSIGSVMVILGCWFHFCQALRRKIAEMSPLFKKIREDPIYSDIFRRFQCLPLLPLEHIAKSFIDLSKEALKVDKDLFSPFINYFHKEWMSIVTPKYFCVYMSEKRTTSDAESFNGQLNKIFKAHPGLFLFVETLQKVEASSSNELMNYVNGTQQVGTTNKYFKARSKMIEKLSTTHRDDPNLLLKLLANIKNKCLFSDKEILIDNNDIEMTADVELFACDEQEPDLGQQSLGNEQAPNLEISRKSEDTLLRKTEHSLLQQSNCNALIYSGSSEDEEILESDEGISSQSSTNSTSNIPQRITRFRATKLDSPRPSTSGIAQTKKKTTTMKRRETDSDEDSNSDNGSNFESLARTTRGGLTAIKLIQKIVSVLNNKENLNHDSHLCIICCDNRKTMLLFPCTHQHTCEACWALWCIEYSKQQKNVSFDEDNENATKPICPYCKQYVDEKVAAKN